MLSRRLQVLIDDDRYERLEREARRRGVAVAGLVREAIDALLPVAADEREAAGGRILDAQAMPVPEPGALRAELEAVRGRRG